MKRTNIVITSLFILSLSLFLGSCDDSAGFFLENELMTEIHSIEKGAVLQPGESFPFYLENNSSDQNYDTLEMVILSTSGEEEFSASYGTGDVLNRAGNATLTLPENLNPGNYILNLSVLNTGSIVVAQQIPFYITNGKFAINSVSVYPPQVNPGSTVIFNADISAVSGLDPVLVWRGDDKILKEGPLSEIGHSLVYTVPDEEGVYPISVEIYPGTSIQTDSYYQREHSEIIVTSANIQDRNPLFPEEHYLFLLHFLGNLINDADDFRGNKNPEIQGNIQPLIRNGDYGYAFDKDTSVTYDSFLLPVEQGKIQPFSISMHLSAPVQGNSVILSSYTDPVSSSFFSFYFNGNGELSAEFHDRNGNSGVSSLERMDFSDEPVWVTLSCEPGESSISLFWYLDGEFVEKIDLNISPVVRKDLQESFLVLGATEQRKGFSGFLDELGVYYRNSNGEHSRNKDIYSFFKRKQYGYDLILAEGFDGEELSSGLTRNFFNEDIPFENNPGDPDAFISESSFKIQPGEVLSFSREILPEEFELIASLKKRKPSRIFFIGSSGKVVKSLDLQEKTIDISLSGSDQNNSVTWSQDGVEFSENINGSWEYLLIQTGNPDQSIFLESILVLNL